MNKETPTSADASYGNSDDVGKTDNIQPQADNSGKGQPAVKPTNEGSDKGEDSESSSDVSAAAVAAATKESAPAAGVLHSAVISATTTTNSRRTNIMSISEEILSTVERNEMDLGSIVDSIIVSDSYGVSSPCFVVTWISTSSNLCFLIKLFFSCLRLLVSTWIK